MRLFSSTVLLIALVALAGCAIDTPLRSTKALGVYEGKTYAILLTDKIPIHTQPEEFSRVFYLTEPEQFMVLEKRCIYRHHKKECDFSDNMGEPYGDPPMSLHGGNYTDDELSRVYFKVRFESGKTGFINAAYFYPRPRYMATEESSEALGEGTPLDVARNLRDRMKKASAKQAEELEKERQKAIEGSGWSAEDKELISKRQIRIGMTKEQIAVVMQNIDGPPSRTETGTSGGIFEEWRYSVMVYYFRDGLLERWEKH